MAKRFHFPIVVIDEDFRSENVSGSGIRNSAEAITDNGVEVLCYTSYVDLTSFAQQASRASSFIVSIDDEEIGQGSEDETDQAIEEIRGFIAAVRKSNPDIPIFLDDLRLKPFVNIHFI